MSLIEKLLKKRGIDSLEKLSPEEKTDYDRWQRILSTGELTIDKIKEFCDNQVKLIEMQWKNLDNDQRKNERLIIFHNVYKTLIDLIASPKTERESLEKYLNQLIESKEN